MHLDSLNMCTNCWYRYILYIYMCMEVINWLRVHQWCMLLEPLSAFYWEAFLLRIRKCLNALPFHAPVKQNVLLTTNASVILTKFVIWVSGGGRAPKQEFRYTSRFTPVILNQAFLHGNGNHMIQEYHKDAGCKRSYMYKYVLQAWISI